MAGQKIDIPEILYITDTLASEIPLKYVCLVYSDEKDLTGLSDAECLEVSEDLKDTGHKIAAEALQPVNTATTVRVRKGKVAVTDGPFAETKEQLAGFYLIEAADIDEAAGIAARIPAARVGSIEVRPVRELVP